MKKQKKCECHSCTQARASGRTGHDSFIEERQETDAYIRKRKTEKTIMHLNDTVDKLTQINVRLVERINTLESLTSDDRIDKIQRTRLGLSFKSPEGLKQ